MSLQLNRIQIAGHITRDPDRRFVGDRSVCNFGVAINRRFKASDNTTREETTFVDVEAWGALADFIGKYFAKGSGIYVEGRLKLDQWKDKDGTNRQRLKLVAERASFTTSKREDSPGGEDPPIDHVDAETGEVFRKKPAAAKGGAR